MSRRSASWGLAKVAAERERERQTDTSPVSKQRSCGARCKAGMGQVSKVLEFCHPLLPPPTFPGERRRRNLKKKKKREKWSGEEVGRVGGGKGGRKARHTAVFGLERSSGKHVTVSSSGRDSYFASFTPLTLRGHFSKCPLLLRVPLWHHKGHWHLQMPPNQPLARLVPSQTIWTSGKRICFSTKPTPMCFNELQTQG